MQSAINNVLMSNPSEISNQNIEHPYNQFYNNITILLLVQLVLNILN